jgi:hypothetical protein
MGPTFGYLKKFGNTHEIDLSNNQKLGQFGIEIPFKLIYIIWFMCGWTMIVVNVDIVAHDMVHTH